MSEPVTHLPDSSNSEDSSGQCPPINESLHSVFQARLLADCKKGEADIFLHNYRQSIRLGDLFTEVQRTYDRNQERFIAEVRLRKIIEDYLKNARVIHEYSQNFLRVIEEIAFEFCSGREAFVDFMGSRAVQRKCVDLLDDQLEVKRGLIESKLVMKFRLSDRLLDNFPAVAHYMAIVQTFFDSEFKRYAPNVFPPEPTDEDMIKLRGLVSCMCYHGVRSLGRLFAHGQYVRLQLKVCESAFLGVWRELSEEEDNRAMWDLAVARDVLHSTRHTTMVFVALAKQFVHDEEDDRFIAFCRAQEDRISSAADLLYTVQDRAEKLMDMFKRFPIDIEEKNEPSSFAADPVEMKMGELNLISGGYNVFLAHDGSEDSGQLARCLQMEIQKRGMSCYMEINSQECDIPCMSEATEQALDDACVGVFLLTPEFAKEKWIVAQLRHMLRRVREARVGWPGPTLIPVFYKVSVRDCRDGNMFGEGHEDIDILKSVFDEITRYTGIENLEGAMEGNCEKTQERRYGLLKRTADAVAEACLTMVKESKEELRLVRSEEVSDEYKKSVEEIRQQIAVYRRWQREARERASPF